MGWLDDYIEQLLESWDRFPKKLRESASVVEKYYPNRNSVPESDRIWRTELGGYNQVIALTQHMINTGIQNFYRYLQINNQLPKPYKKRSSRDEYISKVVFGPPAVVIKASLMKVDSVLLTISLKSGNVCLVQKWEDLEDGEFLMEKASLALKNLTVKVPANVSMIGLEKDSDRYKEMQKRMRLGDHSIYQLLVDLTNAVWDLGKWDKNDWVTIWDSDEERDEKKRPEGWKLGEPRIGGEAGKQLQTKLKSFFSLAARDVITEGMLTMGYIKKYDTPTRKPTFEVNHLRLQTYPWIDDDGQTVEPSYDGRGRLNYLLYLETVGENEAPSEADRSQSVLRPHGEKGERRGNWTDGIDPDKSAPSRFGSFVLAKSCFIENYILPKLENVNRVLNLEIIERDCSLYPKFLAWDNETRYKARIGFEWPDQNVEKSDPAYAFKQGPFEVKGHDYETHQLGPLKEWERRIPQGMLQWNWSRDLINTRPGGQRYYLHVGSLEEWVYCRSSFHSRVLVIPGSNKIIYQAMGYARVGWELLPSKISSTVYGGFFALRFFHIVLTMRELQDGALYFGIEHGMEGHTYPEESKFAYGVNSLWDQASKNLEYIVNGLRTSLNEQNTFIFPSSGVYFFKNPIFDHKANIMCELEFKGIGQDGELPKNGDGIKDPKVPRPPVLKFDKTILTGHTSYGGEKSGGNPFDGK